ncbi:ferritin [Proteobacteria bacterium 005FR1]|nr:ferritin [Proteobacteria bacterium 005FR1]
MAGASESYHEPLDQLTEETRNMHRALVSLQEELEAVDWYRQRADATADKELKDILLHNMREEIEHAAMVLEWLRRNSSDFDEQLSTYLFTGKPLLQVEEEAEEEEAGGDRRSSSEITRKFTIGDLKGR